MKLRTLLAPLLLLSASSAFATPIIYTQNFDGQTSGLHYKFVFEADDTNPTVITTLLSGSNFNGHALSVVTPYQNLFTPSTLSAINSRGWNSAGFKFTDNLKTYVIQYLGINETAPGVTNFVNFQTEYAINFVTTTGSNSVDEPAVFGLLAMAGLATVVSRRKRQHLA